MIGTPLLPLVEAEAIVLRTLNFQEADRVVTLFVRDIGKVSALARGARKSLRRFAGLGSFALGTASLRERGGDLWSLEGFDVTNPRTALGSDLVKAAHGAYACELVERLSVAQQADSDVFHLLDDVLNLLEKGAPSSERLRCFELAMLSIHGLAPEFDHCRACGRNDLVQTGGRWLSEEGGMVCPQCGSRGLVVAPQVVKALSDLLVMQVAEASNMRFTSTVNNGCRTILVPFIERHVGAPLKSMAFLAKLARSSALARPASSVTAKIENEDPTA
jgi:DNA repair protein RecO (recombination protein O)